jgi:hypothetical protein
MKHSTERLPIQHSTREATYARNVQAYGQPDVTLSFPQRIAPHYEESASKAIFEALSYFLEPDIQKRESLLLYVKKTTDIPRNHSQSAYL